MSTDGTRNDDEERLELDWTDALERWELDLDSRARAEAAPLSTAPAPSSKAPPESGREPSPERVAPPRERPRMYRPPSPDELASGGKREAKTLPPPNPSALAALARESTLAPRTPVPPRTPAPTRGPAPVEPERARSTTAGPPTPAPTRAEPSSALEVLAESGETPLPPPERTARASARAAPSAAELQRRIARLEALASGQSGEARAELLITAAELCESLGERERAEELYRGAAHEAPRHLGALQALARLALGAGDASLYVQLLERKSALEVDAATRARALAELALARWTLQRDAPAALGAATEAERLAPNLLAPSFLLARIELATHLKADDTTLVRLAARTRDQALSSVWLVAAGRALEEAGELAPARALYAQAAASDPYAFDAQVALARVHLALGDHGEAGHALLRTLENFEIGPVAEAVRRRSAQMISLAGEHRRAVELLEHESDDVSLRTAVQVAFESGEPALQRRAVESWTLGTDGPERALALLTGAELAADRGDFGAAESALALAALADAQQPLVTVARESLARRSGNHAQLAQAVAGEQAGRGALAAAAKLVSAGAAESELEWLLQAAEEPSGHTARALAIDACAELDRGDALAQLLAAEAERGSFSARAAALLALSEFERERGQQEARREALRRAVELTPHDVALLRAFGRAEPQTSERISALQREAQLAHGARAAFVRVRQALAHAEGSPERLQALAQAYAADPSYAPAAWALHREARSQGDLARLGELHLAEAARTVGLRDRVGHLVRAGLVRASEDGEGAARALTEALALAPDDPVLCELVIRLGEAAPGPVRALALDTMAARVSEPFRSAFRLAAAGILESEHLFAEAAERYRTVLRDQPGHPIAEAAVLRVLGDGPGSAEALAIKLREVDEASTERSRAQALEDLLLLRDASGSTHDWAHELLALVPSHPLALRAVERGAMARDDRSALASVQLRYLDASRGPGERDARLRFSYVLAGLGAPDEEAVSELDRKLLERATPGPESAWVARQLMGAAVASGRRDAIAHALALHAPHTEAPLELASLAVQQAWLALPQAPERASQAIERASRASTSHPSLLELRAELQRTLGELARSAELFEQAARAALSSARGATLWMKAALLWDRDLKQPARAEGAYQGVLAQDLGYPGARARLQALLSERGDLLASIELARVSIAHGGSPGELSGLETELAGWLEETGDLTGARLTLRSALARTPERLEVWRPLARICARLEQHDERLEALLAIARLSADPNELLETQLALGEIYASHLAQPARAIAAYQRALKLSPQNSAALAQLATLYRSDGQRELASETLGELVRVSGDDRQRREATLTLSRWKEEQGELRGAEELLETLRRAAPTDGRVLAALTDLLQRSDEPAALAIHLDRAAHDLRQALARELASPALFHALAEVLSARGRSDAVVQCIDTARALGIEVEERAGLPSGARAGKALGAAALSELLDDLVFPERAPAALRILFRHGADALQRAAPLDLRALGAERLDKRHPLRAILGEQARWVAHRDLEVYTSAELPYAFVPIQDAPIELLVGTRILASTTPAQQRFLVARALKIARAQMSITCRLAPQELELLLHGLVRSQLSTHLPPYLDLSALEEATKRVARFVSRRAQGELMPCLLELTHAESTRFDGAQVYGVASIAGSRAGLLATGDIGAALSGLCELAGLSRQGEQLAEAIAQVEEARELVGFSIGTGYLEALARAGREAR